MNKMIKYIFSILTITLCLSFNISLQAQSGSYGNTYIQSESQFPVYGIHYFGNSEKGESPGLINTNKGSTPGMITFFEGASWINVSDYQYINGYVRTFSNEGFTFPIGDLGFYRPLSISEGGTGTSAAYFLDNPVRIPEVVTTTLRSNSDAPKYVLSDTEYWMINGDMSTRVTITYDINSSIADITEGDISKLKMLGWNGNEWEVVPSKLDEYSLDNNSFRPSASGTLSTLSSGSLTTIEPIVPNDYTIITFGVESRGDDTKSEIEFNTAIVNNEKIEFTIFPNPSFSLSEVNVDYKLMNIDSEATLVVYNANGQLIYDHNLKESKNIYKLPFSDDTNGTYYLGITTANGSRLFKPVIITGK